ncbi:phosphotransferase family protein [Halomarina halobia]|uniref:Phosphotransferase family protein n=1 Tax=Halomarina halobia TaxID=3033386 RepID=A0ABD6ACJ9_9EURY|nr:phosphotransferase family protein [Halomarina sp. PSR21]
MSDGDESYFERLVDVDALESHLETHLGSAETFEVNRHAGGHSNETLFVTWGDRELVVRRPPPGETADTAHDVLREYTVMEALQETGVPVPETVLACEDHDVLGCDFYVMERENGVVMRDAEPDQFAEPSHRRRIGEEMVDTLGEIHRVDYESVGLAEFGRPERFTQRQVDRWQRQYEWAFEVTADEREVPAVEEVTDWLQAHVPDNPPHALVHGDYKLDNVMFGDSPPPMVRSVFDWEMSTLGDPFADLGWLLSYWPDADDRSAAVGTASSAAFVRRHGYPTRDELVDRYESVTGLAFENERFYRTLAVYKLGALGEMFFRRHLEGNADDDTYPQMETRVPKLADRALRIVEGEA